LVGGTNPLGQVTPIIIDTSFCINEMNLKSAFPPEGV
jgi:hypothetical protein